MEKKYLDIVVNKERLSTGAPVFVAHCTTLGIASQGEDTEEAIANLKEAIDAYFEEQPEKYEELELQEPPIFSVVEVTKRAKAASAVR